jgi:hypothetical protein
MFSGGVDSTVAALSLLDRFRNVHLLTYANGHGHYGFERARKRAVELESRYPGRVRYFTCSTSDLFRRVGLTTLHEDYRRYRSGFIWCLGCKLTMHARSIIYCRTNGLRFMSDGSARDSAEMVEQMDVSVGSVRRFYADWGIEFQVPAYDLPRAEKQKMLADLGFRMGIPVRDRYLGIQPSCIPGELYYLPYVLFNRDPGHRDEDVLDYIGRKRPLLDEAIRDALGTPASADRVEEVR